MRRALLLAVVALAVLPATALGATRYASPGGTSSGTCAEGTPCSLAYAITAAAAGDEIVVASGTYPVPATIEATVPLSIHGVAGEPRPRIVGAKEVTPLETGELLLLADVAMESTESLGGTLFAYADGDVFDHVELIAHGGLALRSGGTWSLTDSLLVAKGPGFNAGLFIQGVAPGTAIMRNDTVITEGEESLAVSITGVAPIVGTIQATNVIAIGEIAAEARDNKGSMTSISFDHSDLQGKVIGAVTSTAAQTAAPQFVAPAAGDYRQAPGSPTVDTGVNDPRNGPIDFDGNPRSLPGHYTCGQAEPPAITDIGAFELVPAIPACAPPPPTGTPVHESPPPPPGTVLGKVKIKGRAATFHFAAFGQKATAFECKLDGKAWAKCTSPVTYKGLKVGRHAFRVRAVGAGGTDGTPALRKFKIHRRRIHHRGVS